jgi:hypothetical protein
MTIIYSKVDVSLILHIIVRPQDFTGKQYLFVTEIDAFLQSIGIRLNEGDESKPHKHIESDVNYTKRQQQEAWVVLNGVIRCDLYDIDDTMIESHVLMEKQTLITLYGGHSLTALEDNTFILEFKTGPYRGNINDKILINK